MAIRESDLMIVCVAAARAGNPNPVDADIAKRMFVNTVELIIGMEGE